MTTFDEIPYDIILIIGKLLDYESIINWNRTLSPIDRIVHRKFTQQEAIAHEMAVWIPCLLRRSNKLNDFTMYDDIGIRKKSKIMMDFLCMLRKKHRASIVLRSSLGLYTNTVSKCKSILDPTSDVIRAAFKTDQKRIRKIARQILTETLQVVPVNIKSNILVILPTP